MKQFDSINSSFNTSEIADNLKIDRKLVDEALDVLYINGEIDVIRDSDKENKFFITDKGFATHSSRTILNEGKIINSQLYNNYASSIFQILTGLTALATILVNFTVVGDVKDENAKLRKSLDQIEKQLKHIENDVYTRTDTSMNAMKK